jgi:hypothetical protein
MKCREGVSPTKGKSMKIIRKVANLTLVLAAFLLVHTAVAQTTTESTTTTTTSAGTVTQVGPETLVVTPAASSTSTTTTTPVAYSYSKTTTYVDELGNPVSVETVKSGLPVTVYYSRVGDKMVASKVIVRKATTVTPVTPVAPTIEKKTSTTTTTTE